MIKIVGFDNNSYSHFHANQSVWKKLMSERSGYLPKITQKSLGGVGDKCIVFIPVHHPKVEGKTSVNVTHSLNKHLSSAYYAPGTVV